MGAVVLVGLLIWSGSPQTGVSAAPLYDWCYNSCGSAASCDLECENDGGGGTTCGEYDGGASNGWCNGDTCEDICWPFSGPSEACYHQGQPADCYGYGDYATCGDDHCAFFSGAEDCHSCATDCGACPFVDCGNDICEYGESYRTCPEECHQGGTETPWCGDGTCDWNEDASWCVDCQFPNEFCDGPNPACPEDYQCTANWCTWDDVFAAQTCATNADCAVGYKCLEAWNVMTNRKELFCLLDRT